MQSYSLTHVSDAVLLRDLAALVARDRMTTAEILAHITEVDARRLYAPAGYSSMYAYCVGELGLSEDAAAKRIHAARVARRLPQILPAVADGRLHLAGVCLLAPHMTEANADQLIERSLHKRKSEIEEFLARSFSPSVGHPAVLRPLATAQHAPGHVAGQLLVTPNSEPVQEQGSNPSDEHAPGHVDTTVLPEPERFLLRLTIGKSTHAKIRYLQALLSHAVPSGDVVQVIDRALDALISQLEHRKFGDTARPRRSRASGRRRHIPAEVRRVVWERDRGQCTFVSANATRCQEHRFLEFDHIEPVALGGTGTARNIRLRCRTHNQYEADRVFGANFMQQKRREQQPHAERKTETQEARDILAGLRNLGCLPGDARRAAEYAAGLPLANIQERMRAALQFHGARFISNRPMPAG